MDNTPATPTVTQEVVSKHGATYRVVQVLVDGKVVGYVVGRPEKAGGPRWWANFVSDSGSFAMSEVTRLVYGVRDRQQAVENLLFNAKRNR